MALLAAMTALLSPFAIPVAANEDSMRVVVSELMAEAERLRKAKTTTRMDSAIALFDSARALAESEFGERDTAVASCLHRLGSCYYWKTDYEHGESLNRQAIEIWEEVLGPDHPEVGRGLMGLAAFCAWKSGRFTDAEELHHRAIRLFEKEPETYRLELALSHTNIAEVYNALGRYSDAEASLSRSIEVFSGFSDSRRNIQFIPLMDLGGIYLARQEYGTAEEYALNALDALAQIHPPDHYYVSSLKRLLAAIYVNTGRYDEAVELVHQSIKIAERAFGSAHSVLIPRLNLLSRAELARRNPTGALAAAERAFRITKSVYGESHPQVSGSLRYLGRAYICSGDEANGLATFRQMITSRRAFMDIVLSAASESQRLRFVRRYPTIDNAFVSFALGINSPESRRLVLETLLAGKALVFDALSAERNVAYCTDDTRLQDRLREHGDVCESIATIALGRSRSRPSWSIRDSLETLYDAKNRLESDIGRLCAEFKVAQARRAFGVDDIARRLPENSMLWEFLRYRPSFACPRDGGGPRSEPPRYMAVTLGTSGDITMTDLGEAAVIDSLIETCQDHLRSSPTRLFIDEIDEKQLESELAAITSDLYRIIVAPLETSLTGSENIFVSPDGQLGVLPFELLHCPDGNYLVENYSISYLSSGRELLKHGDTPASSGDEAMLYADPDYDAVSAGRSGETFAGTAAADSVLAARGTLDRSACLADLFRPLPATRREGDAIERLLKTRTDWVVRYEQGVAASEENLKSMGSSPVVLHLATHGYFCPDARFSGESKSPANHLLRSGLALAGANRMISDGNDEQATTEDGILTALEASGLNLNGTELVVLSACQSGVGGVIDGEGVYGLRRAFQQAGARSIVMSMFAVSDKATVGLIKRFYENWIAGDSKAVALRKSSLNTMHERRRIAGSAHPLFWGGFILVGDPN